MTTNFVSAKRLPFVSFGDYLLGQMAQVGDHVLLTGFLLRPEKLWGRGPRS
jgi:hypothetical protein